jgi:3-isopropylmalate dehydratase small subunit
MATEMGAIIIFFTPTDEMLDHFKKISEKDIPRIIADDDAEYYQSFDVDFTQFKNMIANPGHPHDDVDINDVKKTKIDSAFIGSCTNGRIEDLRITADILKGKKVAPGVVLKIVPSTDEIWTQALDEGLIKIFKSAGVLVSNAGCAGCAAGQVGQNGPGEITMSTGNRNFAGKQGKGSVYLASPSSVAASAVAGYITTADDLPDTPAVFGKIGKFTDSVVKKTTGKQNKKTIIEGRVWLIEIDDIDTDMIFHNRYLTITDINEMGQYAFDNLEGYKDFAKKAKAGEIIMTGKNFGSGSSRQQAVDCFKSLGIQSIVAESYGAIYERNAINAAFPILTYDPKVIKEVELKNQDEIRVNFETGEFTNLRNNKTTKINGFYEAQMDIYKKGGLLT